ncbi:MAG: hypothetical protein U5K31_01440 [Balneolaceae bacterium]|nr:hypothetical protein [Balneolaceae bacterium]
MTCCGTWTCSIPPRKEPSSVTSGDRPQRFQQLAERFLGSPIPDVHIGQLA